MSRRDKIRHFGKWIGRKRDRVKMAALYRQRGEKVPEYLGEPQII